MDMTFNDLNALLSVEMLFSQLGISKVKDCGDYYSFSSPFREDKNPSMVMYKDNLMCIDFANGYKKGLFKLVEELTGQKFTEFTGIDPKDLSSMMFFKDLPKKKDPGIADSERVFHGVQELKLRVGGLIDYNPWNNKVVLDYLRSRHISDEFIKAFSIGYTRYAEVLFKPDIMAKIPPGTLFKDRLCIPLIFEGRVQSMEGRDFTRRQKPKVLYPKNGTVQFLFNYDNLDKHKPLVVTEGIMDLPYIWDHITKNVTCVFGAHITPLQRRQLNEFDMVIFCPDIDDAGDSMLTQAEEFMENEYYIAKLEWGDPGETDFEQMTYVIEHPQSAVDFLLESSGLFDVPEKDNIDFWNT